MPSIIFRELKNDARDVGWRELLVTIIAALCVFTSLSIQDDISSSKYVTLLWAPFNPHHFQFYAYVNWFLNYFIFYLCIPVAAMCSIYRCTPSSFGLGIGNLGRYAVVYAILFIAMIPVVIVSSQSYDFSSTYPLMQLKVTRLIIMWEFLYVIQFIAVEFFFRGFLLFPFCDRFGSAGILFSVIPYCIIHLGKPVPEAIGAIATGIILGYLAWKSKSIWGGVILHGAIALLMDILALFQKCML